jgi:hypothetical protein
MAAAMGGIATGKQAVALSSGFCGTPLKKIVSPAKSASVSFAVRAAGYDEELVKTAVWFWFLGAGDCVDVVLTMGGFLRAVFEE